MARAKRALIVMHDPDNKPGLVGDYLEKRGYNLVEHLVTHDTEHPDKAEPFSNFVDFDLVVLMGSVHSLTRKDEIESWVHEELDLIRSATNQGVPILGVCFGGQLLADALGGSVRVAKRPEIGWYAIKGASNPVGRGPWFEWHHDRLTAPKDAEILAENENATQMFRIGRNLGTQFHPEVTPAHVERWFVLVGDEYLSERGVDQAAILAECVENDQNNRLQSKMLVDYFLDEVATMALDEAQGVVV
jgi:GMP synthase-like glutamine amidotransferase